MIGAAIYLHPVALIFVNIIVDQIWQKATIFGLLITVCAFGHVGRIIYQLSHIPPACRILAVQGNSANIDDGIQYCKEEIIVIPVDDPGCARKVGAELFANTSSWDKGKGDGSKEEATGDGEEKGLVERPT